MIFWILAAVLALEANLARGQGIAATDGHDQPDKDQARNEDAGSQAELDVTKQAIKRFAGDQRDLWTSPIHVRSHNAKYFLLLGGAAAGLLVADHAIMQHNTLSPQNMRRSVDFSNVGLGALVGVGGAFYLWGKMTGDDHKQETGLLSGESAIGALAVSTVLGEVLGRERPNVDGARGNFFRGGKSFPSDHSAIAWSIASMISHQYPGRFTKLFAYGLASAVSASRVTGNQHFPSDVFVGGAMGWFIAKDMYRKHHDPTFGGEAWGGTSGDAYPEEPRSPQNLASPYVPLDSWIYPALERLASLGYVRSEFLGMRPWTRNECARLVQEAGETIQSGDLLTTPAGRIYNALADEFSSQMDPGTEPIHNFHVESIYTRLMGISGQPLNDSYHFGQTLINDFGRPYQEGFSPISGFSGWGNWGRVALYVRGEYQHSPSAPAYSQSVRDLIAQIDVNPVQPATPVSTINRFTLLDTYALTRLGDWDFSFGKQSLWWGPNEGGSLLLSDNAEPFYMFRVARDVPFKLPGFLDKLGPVKLEAFMGKLSGNQFPPRPLFHGEKLSLKPTPNLEISFSRTGEFGGVGRPLTFGSLFNTYFATQSSFEYPTWDNPGQRNGGFDMDYRIPGLRNWLSVYTTLLSRDDVTPLVAFFPVRAMMSAGFYLSHVPRARRLDFRGEAVSTDPRNGQNKTGQWGYWENFYHDDYTSRNNLMGDWIGRTGTGYQMWSTYWFGPKTNIQAGYRHAQIDSRFIPHGGTLNDGSIKANVQIGSAFILSAYVQYENWLVTVLSPRAKNDVTTGVQLTLWPRDWGLSR